MTRVARREPTEEGSAVVEFVLLGVLLLVPLLYLVLMVARVQAGSYAVSTAAREAGRVFVTAPDAATAVVRADTAARIAFADQGFDNGTITPACDGDPCLRPGGRVEWTATVAVPLPFVPDFARDVVPLTVPVSATHVVVVDPFRSLP